MAASTRIAANGTRLLRQLLRPPALPARTGNWIVADVNNGYAERSRSGFGQPEIGLLDFLRCLEAAAKDEGVEGVLIRMRGDFGSFGHALSLQRGIERVQAAGRKVVVWAETLSAQSYLAACAADRVWLPESASLFLVGLASDRFFFRDILDRIGARPEVVHIGKFKSAGETFTRDTMSEEERQQVGAWQGDLFEALVDGIAAGRGLDPERVRTLIDEGPYSAGAAVDAGLIDAIVYPDEIEEQLATLFRAPAPGRRAARRAQPAPLAPYYAARVEDVGQAGWLSAAPSLAFVLAQGSIGRGEGGRGISAEGMGALLDGLREDEAVRGVLLRIDSPGGDALASDLLHRRIEALVDVKPVVVSMGDVAASGGYYMAAAADQIFAEAGTVTGSIGVVGGKLNLEGLYERLGISKDGVQHGARAGLLSEARGFTPDERAAVRREMESMYETFLDRVGAGRQLDRKALDAVAQGRIFSGREAQGRGLVDTLGGPLEALRALEGLAGFSPDEPYALLTLPRPQRLPEWVGQALGSGGLARWKAYLGARWLLA